MTNESQIPIVTIQDLLDFHFGALDTSLPPTLEAVTAQHEGLDEEDDGLGYYEDGVKRTLTDEEIAIFRHSEIHALRLRLEREKEDAEEAAAEAGERSEGEVSEGEVVSKDRAIVQNAEEKPARQGPQPATTSEAASHKLRGEKNASDAGESNDEDEDEAAYAKFLKQERKEFEFAAYRQRQKQKTELDPYDRSISTRRRVRELDCLEDSNAMLDYGDGDTETQEPMTGATDAGDTAAVEGRKIWWPELGVKVKFFEDG